MPDRVTPGTLFARARFDLSGAFLRLARIQNQISTSKRLGVVSDGPSDAKRVLDLRGTLARTKEARDAVASARFSADTQASTLQEMSTQLIAARAKAEQAASSALNPSDLEVVATDLDVMLDQLVSLANQRLEGRYLFAGSQVDTLPFQVMRQAGSITSVAYLGDDVARTVQLGPHDVEPVEMSGEDVFLAVDRGPTVIAGNVGLAAVADAHDTMIGAVTIVVDHAATTLGDGLLGTSGDSVSGLAPGASSAADTVVGAHSIAVVSDPLGGGGTISLDGGDPVPFTGSETDLVVTAPDGAVVHLDVSALASGFNGTVALGASATIAVDGGPAQALVASADFALQDGAGRVVHLDTTNVRRSGDSLAVFPGTQSVFDVMIGLRDDLRGEAGFAEEGLTGRIQARLAAFDQAHESVLGATARLGARSAGFERIEESLALFELTAEEKRGRLEDTDFISASIELSQAESAYQAALAAAARLSRPTLLNFL